MGRVKTAKENGTVAAHGREARAGWHTSRHCTFPTLYLDSSPSSISGLMLQRQTSAKGCRQREHTVPEQITARATLDQRVTSERLQQKAVPIRRCCSVNHRAKVHVAAAHRLASHVRPTLFPFVHPFVQHQHSQPRLPHHAFALPNLPRTHRHNTPRPPPLQQHTRCRVRVREEHGAAGA